MAKTSASNVGMATDENSDLQAAVCAQLAELASANQRMAERQTRINKLRIETCAMLDSLKTS